MQRTRVLIAAASCAALFSLAGCPPRNVRTGPTVIGENVPEPTRPAFQPKHDPAADQALEQAIATAATTLGSTKTLAALAAVQQQARDVCHTPLSL